MPLNDKYAHVIEELSLLVAELKEYRSAGPRFRILHRFREPGLFCAPGEEVAAVYLVHRSREIVVPLSLTLRLLFDFFAKHRHLPQNATQVAVAMQADPFYRKHGNNARGGAKLTRKISRSSVKEFVTRIRRALEQALREADVAPGAPAILRSERTLSNEVGYQLKAICEWIHLDHPDRSE